MRRVSLRQLRAFSEAARTQSFARAASALHVTQPAVSMQIRELESAVGLPLFERSGRAVRLTTSGEYFLVYTRRILATLKEAEDTIARLRGLKGGRVSIGMVGTAEHFLPRLLASFRSEHPAIETRLTVGNREQLVRALHDNEVDLAVMGRAPRELAARSEPFAMHPLAIIAPAGHPLSRGRRLSPDAVKDEPFIVREAGSGTRAAMEEFFTAHQLAPPVTMEMSGNETIKQAVRAGMGLAFLSLHTVANELKRGELCAPDIRGLPLVRRWHIVGLTARPLSPAVEAFRYFVLEEGEKLLAGLFGKAGAGNMPAHA
jgi:LysR family transcriptional regulator, low CO2-responsive transcriptional regulator